jgi:ketosteroid isomerase-like protein
LKEIIMELTDEDRMHALFAALTAGDLDTFLGSCADDMSLTARGTSARTTIVPKREIVNWHQSMEALAGGTLQTSVSLVLADARENVVLLRYNFERGQHTRSYETANLCTFRSGQLVAWFSYPLNLDEYAEAWGIGMLAESQPA